MLRSSGSRYLLLLIPLWLVAMLPLTFWGLPTAADDPLLFGGDEPWSAEQYEAAAALEQRAKRTAGADVDLDPIVARDRVVHLTTTNADRAEILRRYRLFSRQPDEMITFMALQRMDPAARDFDPKLYQYGGGWIYTVAAALVVGKLLGLITLSSDAGVYLTAPDLFARFYVAARIVSLLFGAAALVAAARIAQRIGGRRAGAYAGLLAAACPVFISGAVEAKPHLASAALTLWAAVFALHYYASGRLRDALVAGGLGGLSFGFVLTGLWSLGLATVFALRPAPTPHRWRHLLAALSCAACAFALTNPYLVINLLSGTGGAGSNLANSTAMYDVGRFTAGVTVSAYLLVLAAGIPTLAIALYGLVWLMQRAPRRTLTVAMPGLLMVAMCVALGAGKPAEFARFLVLPAVLLSIAAGATIAARTRRHPLIATALLLVCVFASGATDYVAALTHDAGRVRETRHVAARGLREIAPSNIPLAVIQAPAPYAVPPLDFTRRHLFLLPPEAPDELQPQLLPPLLVFTADGPPRPGTYWWQAYYEPAFAVDPGPWRRSPITWANKPVYVHRRLP